MNVNDLRQRRESYLAEMRAIQAAPAGEDDDLSTDQEHNLEVLKGKIEKTERRIADREFTDARDLAARGELLNSTSHSRPELRVFARAATPAPDGFDGAVMTAQDGSRVPVLEARHKLADFAPSEQRGSSLSFGGFLKALTFGPSTEAEQRAMAEAQLVTGGAMVPLPIAAGIIDLLRAKSVAFQAGARTIPMTSQTLRFAQTLKYPAGSWRGENQPVVEDQPAFGQQSLYAHTWALLTKVSRELIEDGTNTDAVLRDIFAKTAALALDQAILFGTGTNDQPLGIANTPAIQTVSMGPNGGKFVGWAPVLDAVLALESANAGTVSAMVAAPRTARALYGLTDIQQQPLHPPPRVANIPILVTTSVGTAETQGTASNASSIILGDFSEVLVGLRTSLQISVLNERYADTGTIAFLSWLRADVLLARPAAMARITGITG